MKVTYRGATIFMFREFLVFIIFFVVELVVVGIIDLVLVTMLAMLVLLVELVVVFLMFGLVVFVFRGLDILSIALQRILDCCDDNYALDSHNHLELRGRTLSQLAQGLRWQR